MEIKRTSGSDRDFLELVKLLDEELWQRYPETQQLYEKGNTILEDAHTIVIYIDGIAAGCGCLRDFEHEGSTELKRMYVRKEYRGRRIGKIIVEELEKWASELNKKTIYLETGVNQPEAIFLYERMHYQWIDNYGEYVGNKESICMKKNI